MSLDGKTAIVTGGAKGIGYAIAKRFLQDGARVTIADVDEEAGASALDDLAALGPATFVAADISEKLDVHNLVAETIEAHGDIDILVNNAGIMHAAAFLDLSEDDFDRVLRTNLRGAFLCSQAVARTMVQAIEKGGAPGTIINMSSINARVALPEQIPYCVSKGGISQLTTVTALALAPHGIRVNAIGPGSIMTDMLAALTHDDEARNRVLARTPLRRIGDPSEIASVASFLASDDASYVTGQTIYADGGRLPLNYTVPVET